MENIAEKLNLVIEYIESHLTDEINQDEIAKIACCSYYDVGRIFSLIANINISDYIRKRRLTLAGSELKYNGAKVIDVALKYGYDSPVSFARAFQAFHGFNPSLADKSENVLVMFPRLVYQLCVKGVGDVIKKETIAVNGKEYEASYLGEIDMRSWAPGYLKRKFWRLENAYEDFKDHPRTTMVIPYNNYPPVNIEIGQIFVIDYHKVNNEIERRYYISDGSVWNDMHCTHEFIPKFSAPERVEKIIICGKEYDASFLGEQDISEWSDYATKRAFWRLENVKGEFDDCEKLVEVLPYNNYPPVKIELGQVFVIAYCTRDGRVNHVFHIADGTVWRNMPSTRKFIIKECDNKSDVSINAER